MTEEEEFYELSKRLVTHAEAEMAEMLYLMLISLRAWVELEQIGNRKAILDLKKQILRLEVGMERLGPIIGSAPDM